MTTQPWVTTSAFHPGELGKRGARPRTDREEAAEEEGRAWLQQCCSFPSMPEEAEQRGKSMKFQEISSPLHSHCSLSHPAGKVGWEMSPSTARDGEGTAAAPHCHSLLQFHSLGCALVTYCVDVTEGICSLQQHGAVGVGQK